MNPKIILLVEDEQSIRSICERLLLKMRHRPIFAKNITQGLAQISELEQIDLLITDMRLPDGEGIEVIARFNTKFPAAPVLVITGSPLPLLRIERLFVMGFKKKDVLLKPFEIDEFERAVRAHMPPGEDP